MRSFLLKIALFVILMIDELTPSITAEKLLLLLVVLSFLLLIQFIPHMKLKIVILVVYAFLNLFNPEYALGLPLIIFPGMHLLILFLMILLASSVLEFTYFLIICSLMVALYAICDIEQAQIELSEQYRSLNEQMIADKRHAKKEQDELITQQHHELEVSLLNERNRIARDIHDNVGHLLTSALLQVGAMKAVQSSPALNTLKETLDQGMNAIRSSVHSLYADSFDLQYETENAIKTYPGLNIRFDYGFYSEPDPKIKACFLFAVKEALNNTVKHSNADAMTVQFDESAQYYHGLIQDNGKPKGILQPSGIGLLSLEKRVKEVKGIINIQPDKGYRIYISIAKEESP